MTYLVDANVLSELMKPAPQPNVVRWLRDHESQIAIDPIVLGEIRFGILLLPRGARRRRLEAWFDQGIGKIHCLEWTAANGLRWAELIASMRSAGKAMPIKDSLIAATALVHDLAVATRNVHDFRNAGVRVVDPFTS